MLRHTQALLSKSTTATTHKLLGAKSHHGPTIFGGHWLNGTIVPGSKHFDSTNPANVNDLVGHFPNATATEVKKAVQLSNDAFSKWKSVPAPLRGNFIGKLAAVLEREREHLAQIITREVGKPMKEAIGEVQEAIDTAQFFQSE
jgi:aldehyde dehydrogenase (NAD+)